MPWRACVPGPSEPIGCLEPIGVTQARCAEGLHDQDVAVVEIHATGSQRVDPEFVAPADEKQVFVVQGAKASVFSLTEATLALAKFSPVQFDAENLRNVRLFGFALPFELGRTRTAGKKQNSSQSDGDDISVRRHDWLLFPVAQGKDSASHAS